MSSPVDHETTSPSVDSAETSASDKAGQIVHISSVKRQLVEDYQQNINESEDKSPTDNCSDSIEGGSNKKVRKVNDFETLDLSFPQAGPSTSSYSQPSTSASSGSNQGPSSSNGGKNNMVPISSSICFSVPSQAGMPPRQSAKALTKCNRLFNSSTKHQQQFCQGECSGSSMVQHSSCLYFPGSYSKGKMSKCSLYHCCHCQHPQSSRDITRFGRTPTETASSSSSSSSSNNSNSSPSSTMQPSTSSNLNDRPYTSTTSTGTTRARNEPRPESLLELAARVVAEHYPYECIEKRYRFIPEVVQRRILYWSFPRDESYIRLYSSISSIFKDDNYLSMDNFSFSPGSSMPMMFMDDQSEAPIDLSSQQQSQSHKRLQNTNSSLFNLGCSLMHFRAVHQVLQVGKYN